MKNKILSLLLALIFAFTLLPPQSLAVEAQSPEASVQNVDGVLFDLLEIPEFQGEPYVELNGNFPFFTLQELSIDSFEDYPDLDELGRCRTVSACIAEDLMPTEKRGNIGMVRPSGWQLVKYDFVDGKYLYNRCHLIGFQLAGENANVNNLITGTRYLNIEGMLPFENLVADYVKDTENHVMYRVTPVFEGDDLLARGVIMEGWSVEDAGKSVCFCVFAYNAQPGVEINYANGESKIGEFPKPSKPAETPASPAPSPAPAPEAEAEDKEINSYVLNKNSRIFHKPNCSSASTIRESNKADYTGSRDDLISMGYKPCKRCNP